MHEEGPMDSSTTDWIVIPLTMGKLPFREPPHEALANLRDDAVKNFGAKWHCVFGIGEDNEANIKKDILKCRELLRQAWRRDAEAVKIVEACAYEEPVFKVEISGPATLKAQCRHWEIICILFCRDRAANKIAICANPNCHSPYLVKRRRTQKLCGTPQCKAWLQNKHALEWWHRIGKKKYAKKLQRRKP
jgi:hypothetical protein